MNFDGSMDVKELTQSVVELNKRVLLLELRYVPKTKVWGVYYDSGSTWTTKTLLGIYSTPEIAQTKIECHMASSKSSSGCYDVEEITIDEF